MDPTVAKGPRVREWRIDKIRAPKAQDKVLCVTEAGGLFCQLGIALRM